MRATTVSFRQRQILRLLVCGAVIREIGTKYRLDGGPHITLTRANVRALLKQNWIEKEPPDSYRLTPDGRRAYIESIAITRGATRAAG